MKHRSGRRCSKPLINYQNWEINLIMEKILIRMELSRQLKVNVALYSPINMARTWQISLFLAAPIESPQLQRANNKKTSCVSRRLSIRIISGEAVIERTKCIANLWSKQTHS